MGADSFFSFSLKTALFLLLVGIYCSDALRMRARFPVPRRESKLQSKYRYKTYYSVQNIDHFGFANNGTYLMKYLYADQYWDPKNGPIFFYAGNEGDIEVFCDNSGFMWDIAPKFKALLIFAEHRYYGKSMPYGKDSYKDPLHMQYFTSEQALADYAVFLRGFTTGAGRRNPVIVFGGSYGGMLAAWFRMKYPHIVAGAIAASAPIWQFSGLTDCHTFNRIVTNDFKAHSANCAKNIRRSWDVINRYGATATGRQFLQMTFRLCKPLPTKTSVEDFKTWLYNTYGNLAMINYPYPTSFLEPVPAWPVIAVCDRIAKNPTSYSDGDLMRYLFSAVSIYFNYTGTAKCLDISQQSSGSVSDLGWDYQACTEMVMPMCADGVTDMFEPSAWSFTQYSNECYRKWKVRPRRDWAVTSYTDKNIRAASNIVFSNGHLDPWSGGGVLQTVSPLLPSLLIPEGAHHLDLRGANKADPISVQKVRQVEMININNWIHRWYAEHKEE